MPKEKDSRLKRAGVSGFNKPKRTPSHKTKSHAVVAKVKDKIKNNIARAAASGKIKDCEKIYLKSIKEILTAEQFEKWVKCFKEKYKKK